jgi:class 3 adenylate cyclase
MMFDNTHWGIPGNGADLDGPLVGVDPTSSPEIDARLRLTATSGLVRQLRRSHFRGVKRQLLAVLAADIAGYSRLMGADEEGTLTRLKTCRRERIEPGIAKHHGRIVSTVGDGILIEFPSPVEAVRYGIEMQQGMIDHNAAVPDDKRIEFRVGINLGDVIVDEHRDLYGDAVNIASRLEALAEPGGICISRAVRDQIRDRLALPFVDVGEQSVKNIARPVRVYALSAGAVAALSKAEAPAEPQPASLLYARRRFQKGVSGNPGGRPKLKRDIRERVRVHAGAAIDTLVAVMGDGKAPAAARVSAAVAILDRGYGRPAQAVYQHVTRHADELSDAELIAIATGGGGSDAGEGDDADEPDSVH